MSFALHMPARTRFMIASFALGVVFAAPVWGEEVNIESDAMLIDSEKNYSQFTGNVVAIQGATTSKSDQLIVYYKKQKQADNTEKNKSDYMIAKGNVVITTSKETITGDLARYEFASEVLIIEGNAELKQGDSIIRGEKIRIDRKTNNVKASGGRVSGNFLPN